MNMNQKCKEKESFFKKGRLEAPFKKCVSRIPFFNKRQVVKENIDSKRNGVEKLELINGPDFSQEQHESYHKARMVVENTRSEKGVLDTKTMSYYSMIATYFIRDGLRTIFKKGRYVAYNNEVYTDQMKYLEDCKNYIKELADKGSLKMDITLEEALKVVDIPPFKKNDICL